MDFANLGLNMGVVAGIIALTKVLTSIDKDGKYSRLYPIIPAVLGIGAAAFTTDPLTWQEFGKNFLIYVGAATYIYKVGKTTVLGG